MYFWFVSELYVLVLVKLISWELISRTVDFVRVDLMGVDLVGVDLVRVDLEAPNRFGCPLYVAQCQDPRHAHLGGTYEEETNV